MDDDPFDLAVALELGADARDEVPLVGLVGVTREVDEETTTLTCKLLSAIARLRGQFGAATVAECLAGSESDRMLRWRLHDLSVYGLLKQYTVMPGCMCLAIFL